MPPLRRAPSQEPPRGGTPNLSGGSLTPAVKRSTTPNEQPKDGTADTRTNPSHAVATQSDSSGAPPPPPPPESSGDQMPRRPSGGPPGRSGSGSGSDGGGSGGPPSGPSRVPPRGNDLDWRDRAIRAEALLQKLQAENAELKDRVTALELAKKKLEKDNKTLYGRACVADEWNVWFQEQQDAGYLSGYYRTPKSNPRGTPHSSPGAEHRRERFTHRGRSTSGDRDDGCTSRISNRARSRSGFTRRGKMGERSLTPGRSSAGSADHRTSFMHGLDTMEAINEETLNIVPGIDDDPDDDVPWAANLSFPDVMDLARTIKRDLVDAGYEDREKDGWKGPIGLGGGNERSLLHNVRFWWRPRSGAQPNRFKYDRSLNLWLKTVLLFKQGNVRILLRDAPIRTEVPALEEEQGSANKFLIMCRPPVDVAGAVDPRSTYRGERQPGGQGKRRQHDASRTHGPYTGDSRLQTPLP
ncbi:Gbp1 [Symbiodinium necroappetens]|uniref:Gbp1 protein n=1 Tax=Symbiodinium necroappetens TaxID=1628268 RepID=A0A812XS13_9DINO|nr:Gbp1 [Symbiodinium necroappetens]